jgi:YD repeat-containing protein
MGVTNPSARDLKKTVTYMENMSFDPVYEVLTRIPLTQNPISGNLERTVAIQGNPSMTLTYDGSGNLTTLTKTIDATTYTKTFTWDTGRLTEISEWS